MFLTCSSVILLILSAGLYFRRKPKIHIPLMSTAFACDVLLVLFIEFQRKAIESVVSEVSASPDWFVLFHALISLLVVVLYIALARTGFLVYKRHKPQLLKTHRNLAGLFVLLRLVNYVTSFSMASHLAF